MPRPMPALAPVTSAVLPEIWRSMRYDTANAVAGVRYGLPAYSSGRRIWNVALARAIRSAPW